MARPRLRPPPRRTSAARPRRIIGDPIRHARPDAETHRGPVDVERHEANFPAQQSSSQEDPRIPCAHAHRRRPPRARGASSQGSQAPERLIPPRADRVAPVRPEDPTGSVRSETSTGAPSLETTRLRFPRSARLIKGAEFRHVLARGGRVSGAHLSLNLLRTELASSRVGLAVPRAVGNAVVRNRLKRRLRELFRTRFRIALDQQPGPCDLVIRARSGAGQLTQAELEAEILDLLERWQRGPRGRNKRRRDRSK